MTGGTYDRTYDFSDAGAEVMSADGGSSAGTDPATVSSFRLDKYDVTVGRFRQFVNVALLPDGGAGWRPAPGSGKHAHLNGGQGLFNVGPDAGAMYESGWVTSDDGNISPTSSNLACSALGTWTPQAAAQENLPINCVNWWEAYAFCIWDGAFLPSEAEWEYAAAGGAQERDYPWGSTDPGTANEYAIYNCNYPSAADNCMQVSSIAPVGTATLGAGLWGQLDLAGNMWQWSSDYYAASYVDPCTDCAYLSGGSSRVTAGGSFREPLASLFSANRNANDPTLRNDFDGIRCARTP